MYEELIPEIKVYNDLYILTKGIQKCEPNHSYGPMIREKYLIHFILDGKGIFRKNNVTSTLTAGQFFTIFPGEQTYYEADAESPWEYAWFSFDGSSVAKILNTMGITPESPIGHIKNFDNTAQDLRRIVHERVMTYAATLALQGNFYQLLAQLSPDVQPSEEINIKKVDIAHIYTHKSINIIRERYQQTDFKIKDISEALMVNTSYLTAIVKKTTGSTLQAYLIDYRIQKSKYYLETPDLSISEVAEKVGYTNPVSFTRFFKKIVGLTPSDYKKRLRTP